MKLPPKSERQFQRQVIEYAHLFGWRVAHFRPALRKDGRWYTAVAADGKGWLDLTLVRRQRLVFAELKKDGEYPSPEQREWMRALAAVPGIEVYLWRPRDQDELELVLRSEEAPTVGVVR